MRALFALIPLAIAFFAAAACDEDFQDCYGHDYIECTCRNGALGYEMCGPSGDYESSVCVCDGTTPGLDAGPDADAKAPSDASTCAPDASAKPLFAECNAAAECASCACESIQNQTVCTQACKVDSDCPAGSGCITRGFCRPPQ